MKRKKLHCHAYVLNITAKNERIVERDFPEFSPLFGISNIMFVYENGSKTLVSGGSNQVAFVRSLGAELKMEDF